MEYKITSQDPFGVLASTKAVVGSLKFVKIHEENLDQLAKIISKKLEGGKVLEEMNFGNAGSLRDNVQLIFLEDTVNFCFWAEKDKPKWKVEWPDNSRPVDGWYALTKCFDRALIRKVPILKAEYLENLTLGETKSLFSGNENTEIPLLEKRMENLKEAGKILREKYDGEFINVLKKAEYDAIKIARLIIEDFPSFRDISKLNGKEIYFLKRAQICVQDLSYLKELKIKNVNTLTAFADYKIPQMLRRFGVISYSRDLAKKIDDYVFLPAGSREEIGIRSATIWCIELIKQKLEKYSAAEIDNALWLISQNKFDVKPYHRTYSIYY